MDYIKLFEGCCFITVGGMCSILSIFIIAVFATVMFEILPDKLQEFQEKNQKRGQEK